MIRKAELEDAEGIARVHLSSWQTTYNGIVPDTYLNQLNMKERTDRWQRILTERTTTTYVAENENSSIIGFVNGGTERTGNYDYDGELYAIYLLEECQRQGVGRKLVYQLVETLKLQGYKSMLLWVLKNNPSRRFYESLNPKKVDEKTVKIGGAALLELAFGWSDLTKLCSELKRRV